MKRAEKTKILGLSIFTIILFGFGLTNVHAQSPPSFSFPYDVSTAVYAGAGEEFSVAGQETSPAAMAFNGDGTKMFVLGNSGDAVVEYTLGAAYDVSTAVYAGAGEEFSVAGQETSPFGMTFNGDGTKMFVIGQSGDAVVEYTLGTAYDVSTAVYAGAGEEFSVADQERSPYGITFNGDGTKMFVIGFGDRGVLEYTLGTAYDVSTAVYAGAIERFNLAGQESIPTGMAFNGDGTKMFVIGNSDDAVVEYTLGTAYDVSKAVYAGAGEEFSVQGQLNFPISMTFNGDGTKMYVIGLGSDAVVEYSLATPTAVSFAENGTGTVLDLNANDGDGGAADENLTYSISGGSDASLFAINSSTGELTFVSPPDFENPADSDTNNEYVVTIQADDGQASNNTASITVTITVTNIEEAPTFGAYDVSKAVYAGSGEEFSVADQERSPYGITFNGDGTKMFVIGLGDDAVVEYSLGTAYDVSTAVYAGSGEEFSVAGQETSPRSMVFNSDGTKMFVIGQSGDAVVEYSLGTAYDVSTSVYAGAGEEFSVAGQELSPTGMAFNGDGTKMFVIGSSGDAVVEYTLGTAYDVSTAVYAGAGEEFRVASQETSPTGMVFNADGTKMFVIGGIGVTVLEYTLGTAYDVSTSVYAGAGEEFSVAGQETSPRNMVFNGEGTKMFVIGVDGDAVVEYTVIPTTTSFAENGTGTVFDLNATDGDGGAADANLTYSVSGGSDASLFAVNSTTGELTFVSPPDFENPTDSDANNEYVVIIQADDGQASNNTASITLTITVTDVNDAPKVSTPISDVTVDEDAANTDIDISGTFSDDETASSSLTYTIQGNTNGALVNASISGSTLTLVYQPNQHGTANITVRSSDGSLTVDDTFTVTVNSVNDVPNFGAYDVSTAMYAGESEEFSVVGQETNPYGITFNGDGTKLFVIGSTGDAVVEYTLGTAYDVSTAVYAGAGEEFSVAGQESEPRGMAFNGDGTKMFVIGSSGDAVVEYILGTAYDVSTAVYAGAGEEFSVAGQETSPLGMAFNGDGTKMFVIGPSDDAVVEYTLGTAYDVSTAVYAGEGEEFSVAGQETASYDMAFNSDGTKMFVIGNSGDAIVEYTLATAYDVSTAVYAGAGEEFRVAGQESIPTSMAFNGDGTKMFMSGIRNDAVVEYTLGTPTAVSFTENGKGTVVDVDAYDGDGGEADANLTYSITGGSDAALFAINSSTGELTFVSPPDFENPTDSDANNEYVVTIQVDDGQASNNTASITLTITVIDVNNALTVSKPISDVTVDEYAANTQIDVSGNFSNDETASSTLTYTIQDNTNGTLVNASISGSTLTLDYQPGQNGTANITVRASDGSLTVDDIFKVTVRPFNEPPSFGAYDVSTAVYAGAGEQFSVAGEETSPTGLTFNGDGTKMFVIGLNDDAIVEYSLGTAYDVSTAVYAGAGEEFNVAGQETSPYAMVFNGDGTKMFVIGSSDEAVVEYSLGTAYDVSTAVYAGEGEEFNVAGQEGSPRSMFFNGDGTKMFVIGSSGDAVVEYTLSTAYDVSTAVYAGAGEEFSVAGQETNPYGITFNGFGTKMFVIRSSSDAVMEYTLGTAYDVSTAVYAGVGEEFSVAGQETFPTSLVFSGDGMKMFVIGFSGDAIVEYTLGTPTTASFAENGTGTVFDLDANDGSGGAADANLTYSITGGSDAALFAVNSSTGELTFVSPPDFENPTDSDTNNEYVVTIQADDGQVSNNTTSLTLTITVTNVYDAPTVSTPISDVTVDEDAVNTDIDVSNNFRADALASSSLTYTIQGNTNGALVNASISGSTLTLDYQADKSGTANITVRASDGSLTVDDTFTVTVNSVNDVPTFGAYDVSKAVYAGAGEEFSVAGQVTIPYSLTFNGDGTKMFVIGNGAVVEYTLGTAYDVSTAVYAGAGEEFSVAGQETEPRDMAFNGDGTKMFVIGIRGYAIVEYTLGTAYDVSTAVYAGEGEEFIVVGQEAVPLGMAFNGDGTKMFVIGTNDDTVVEYTLGAAYDVSTAVYAGAGEEFSVAGQETTPYGIAFNGDGTKMFVIGQGGAVVEYTLGTAYDVSTAVYAGTGEEFSVFSQESFPLGMAFNGDGMKMFVIGFSGDAVVEYTVVPTTASFAENGTGTVLDVDASDGDGGAVDANLTYTIAGGSDAALFAVNSSTGELTFVTPPDFENPADADANNEYVVTIQADDGQASNNTASVTVTITVTDIEDSPPVFENNTPLVSNVTGSGFTLSVDIDLAGTIYYVVLDDEANAPSVAEVKAGTGAGEDVAKASGYAVVDGDGFAHDFAISELAGNTSYDIYVVAQDSDATPKVQTTPTKLDVTTANTNPTATNASVIATQNTGYAFGLSDFNFSDANSGDQLEFVDITTLPSKGTLFLDANDNDVNDNEEVVAGDDIPRAELAAGNLLFQAENDLYGKAYSSFTFTVSDGTDFAATASTLSIDVHISSISMTGTSGNDGWRMLGTPSTNNTFAELFDPFWTQGAPNSDAPTGEAQFLTWDESNQSFNALSDFNNTITNGEGFFAFIFEDDDSNDGENDIDGGWPKTLSKQGVNKTGDAVFNLTYTENSTQYDGFNLISNPYPFAIDWDASSGWIKTNMSQSMYVWNPNANNGEGSYETWNGVTGTRDNGIIAPYQAFWVQALDANPVLSATEGVGLPTPASLQKAVTNDSIPSIALRITQDYKTDLVHLIFTDNGLMGKDAWDALTLSPLSAEFVQLSVVSDETRQSIAHLPIDLNAYEVDFEMDVTASNNGAITIEMVSSDALPDGWEPVLFDIQTGERAHLFEGEKFEFEYTEASEKRAKGSSDSTLVSTPKLFSSSANYQTRFRLGLSPMVLTSLEDQYMPKDYSLDQNYPNPFNPTTTINFSMMEAGKVNIGVFDLLGKKVAVLKNGLVGAGKHSISFNALNMASGVYIYRMQVADRVFIKKMTLVK